MLEYGEREWEIKEIIKRNKNGAKIPIPAWYNEKVGVPDELRWFWQAFWELDTCRTFIDTVPSKIPWTAAKQYAEYHEIDFDYLWHLIVCIDAVYVDFHTEKRKQKVDELGKNNTKNKGGRRGR